MKKHLITASLALLALCPVVFAAAEAAASPRSLIEIPVQQVAAKTPVNGDLVTSGTSRVLVSLRLGSPNAVLPDGSWLYSGYSVRLTPSGPSQRGTLVVRFSQSQVTRLTLANEAAVTALRQPPRRPAADQLLAVR